MLSSPDIRKQIRPLRHHRAYPVIPAPLRHSRESGNLNHIGQPDSVTLNNRTCLSFRAERSAAEESKASPYSQVVLRAGLSQVFVSPGPYIPHCLLIAELVGTIRALVASCAGLILEQGSHDVIQRLPIMLIALPMVFRAISSGFCFGHQKFPPTTSPGSLPPQTSPAL